MRIAPSFIKTVIQPTQKSLNSFVKQLHTTYQNLTEAFNGRVSYGDGTNTENIDGSWASVTTPTPAGTNFIVTHGLNRTPVGVHVMQKNAFCDVLIVSSTKTTITLQATAAGAVIKLFIFLLFLCLIPSKSEAQGANHTNIALQTITASGSSGLSGPLLKPIAGAVITVCNGSTLPASGTTCIGTANIFNSITLTTQISNPTNADNNGNYTFWVFPGHYVVSVSGVGLTTYSYIITSACDPTGACTTSGNNTHSGTEAFTGAMTQISTAFTSIGTTNVGFEIQDTFSSIPSSGSILSFWPITICSNCTGNNAVGDGIDSEMLFTGALAGTVSYSTGNETLTGIRSTGGTITTSSGALGYVADTTGATTTVTTAIGFDGRGCQPLTVISPTNCYGLMGRDQTNKASSRNYSIGLEGRGLWLYSGFSASAGMDAETSSHVPVTFLLYNTNGTTIQAIDTNGLKFNDSAAGGHVNVSSTGVRVGDSLAATSPLDVNGNIKLETGNMYAAVEGSCPASISGFDTVCANSTAHALQIANNGGSYFNVAQVISATSSAFATATTAGTCVQNTTAVSGATTSMTVTVSPVSTPGVGAVWSAFVSSAGNVTINECAVATSAGGTIAFNIRVIS